MFNNLKLLKLAKMKKGGNYSLNGRLVRDEIISSQEDPPFVFWFDAYHNIAIFTEVSK